MRVLVVTNMFPTEDRPWFGVFVDDQVKSLKKLGVDVDVLMVDGSDNRIQYLTGFPRLWKQLLKNKYDLIHAHYVYAGMIAKAQWKYPVVLTHHGPETFFNYPGEGFFTSHQPQLCRWVTPKFDEVITVSGEIREKLNYPKAHVIPCGVDLDRFKPMPKEEARTELGLPLDKKLVLWAGNPRRAEKRFELAKAAIEILQKEDPSVELLLAADMPHTSVPMFMNAADAFMLVSDAEGSPMVVKEAMACNVPVIATPTGDVTDVIGGTSGCYITTQDPVDIAEKTKMALAAGQRTNGREAVKHMSLDGIARQVVEVYEKALAKKSRVRVTDTLGQGG
ncbi:MAG: glycosyltransferase [Chloroflexi bacterium]|nr:glycosyltransferase [Chloroflexota bacterium]